MHDYIALLSSANRKAFLLKLFYMLCFFLFFIKKQKNTVTYFATSNYKTATYFLTSNYTAILFQRYIQENRYMHGRLRRKNLCKRQCGSHLFNPQENCIIKFILLTTSICNLNRLKQMGISHNNCIIEPFSGCWSVTNMWDRQPNHNPLKCNPFLMSNFQQVKVLRL